MKELTHMLRRLYAQLLTYITCVHVSGTLLYHLPSMQHYRRMNELTAKLWNHKPCEKA